MSGQLTRASAMEALRSAATTGYLSRSALREIELWLTEPAYEEFVPAILEHVSRDDWATLDEVFHTTLPFGTAGRRGRMYPIGSNAINERTIGETIQGLANFVREEEGATAQLSAAVGYDSRHNFRLFAELAAEILAASGFTVWFLDGPRPTPELAMTVRRQQCHCGVMISASHNPPTDNAVKVFWSHGGQILPFEAEGVISAAAMVGELRRELFDVAVQTDRIRLCQQDMDDAYVDAVLECRLDGPRNVKVLYTPLHGVGAKSILPVLAADGFTDVELYKPHAALDGDFPDVPNHIANPEIPAVFEAPMEYAASVGADLILATDPDADRLGAAMRVDGQERYQVLTGNQIAVLLADFLLRRRQTAGRLTEQDYLVKTMVTSDMLGRVAASYNARVLGDVLTGFKWIGDVIDREGPEHFVFAAEEAHGYLAGTHIRDKDGAVAALLLAGLAAELKSERKTLGDRLDDLYGVHGCYQERTVSLELPGLDGAARIAQIMRALRDSPPIEIADMTVRRIRDYRYRRQWGIGQPPQPLSGPQGDLLILDLERDGNRVAVRPSGTEPKIKFYLFAFEPPSSRPLPEVKQALEARLARMVIDLPDRYR